MSGEPEPAQQATASIRLAVGPHTIDLKVQVPKGPVDDVRLLPLAHSIADAVVDLAKDAVAAEGRSISCRAGCAACCRQLVPVAPVEARQLAALVEALPEPRRTAVRARFAEAKRRVDEAGFLPVLEGRAPSAAELHGAGARYFRLGVACPFLEDENCSIYAARPAACREYLVTSPAANCSAPSAETIRMVDVPSRVSHALRRVGETPPAARWLPLISSLDWSADNPAPLRPGPEILREFVTALAGSEPPPPQPPPGTA